MEYRPFAQERLGSIPATTISTVSTTIEDTSLSGDENEETSHRSSFGYQPKHQHQARAFDFKKTGSLEKDIKARPRSRFGYQPNTDRLAAATIGRQTGEYQQQIDGQIPKRSTFGYQPRYQQAASAGCHRESGEDKEGCDKGRPARSNFGYQPRQGFVPKTKEVSSGSYNRKNDEVKLKRTDLCYQAEQRNEPVTVGHSTAELCWPGPEGLGESRKTLVRQPVRSEAVSRETVTHEDLNDALRQQNGGISQIRQQQVLELGWRDAGGKDNKTEMGVDWSLDKSKLSGSGGRERVGTEQTTTAVEGREESTLGHQAECLVTESVKNHQLTEVEDGKDGVYQHKPEQKGLTGIVGKEEVSTQVHDTSSSPCEPRPQMQGVKGIMCYQNNLYDSDTPKDSAGSEGMEGIEMPQKEFPFDYMTAFNVAWLDSPSESESETRQTPALSPTGKNADDVDLLEPEVPSTTQERGGSNRQMCTVEEHPTLQGGGDNDLNMKDADSTDSEEHGEDSEALLQKLLSRSTSTRTPSYTEGHRDESRELLQKLLTRSSVTSKSAEEDLYSAYERGDNARSLLLSRSSGRSPSWEDQGGSEMADMSGTDTLLQKLMFSVHRMNEEVVENATAEKTVSSWLQGAPVDGDQQAQAISDMEAQQVSKNWETESKTSVEAATFHSKLPRSTSPGTTVVTGHPLASVQLSDDTSHDDDARSMTVMTTESSVIGHTSEASFEESPKGSGGFSPLQVGLVNSALEQDSAGSTSIHQGEVRHLRDGGTTAVSLVESSSFIEGLKGQSADGLEASPVEHTVIEHPIVPSDLSAEDSDGELAEDSIDGDSGAFVLLATEHSSMPQALPGELMKDSIDSDSGDLVLVNTEDSTMPQAIPGELAEDSIDSDSGDLVLVSTEDSSMPQAEPGELAEDSIDRDFGGFALLTTEDSSMPQTVSDNCTYKDAVPPHIDSVDARMPVHNSQTVQPIGPIPQASKSEEAGSDVVIVTARDIIGVTTPVLPPSGPSVEEAFPSERTSCGLQAATESICAVSEPELQLPQLDELPCIVSGQPTVCEQAADRLLDVPQSTVHAPHRRLTLLERFDKNWMVKCVLSPKKPRSQWPVTPPFTPDPPSVPPRFDVVASMDEQWSFGMQRIEAVEGQEAPEVHSRHWSQPVLHALYKPIQVLSGAATGITNNLAKVLRCGQVVEM